ncbi:hypothetical protein JVT61DRAFT_1679 [Boletus reticuloceps]|uniref:Uncharacterized protein n=1 Tax=Boletus reticuloceps TaxID=495285 RepID=A0A8I2YP81_9AGAM|nr:hypothetical protein JVT61DRAFT_1679 [Boletus reticuloceps]
MKLLAWLLAMLGHYPSIKDYEVASAEECVKYWKEHTEEYVQEWALSSSFDRLSLKAMIKANMHGLVPDHANNDIHHSHDKGSNHHTSMTVDNSK